jgi:heme-degrading monooxygenase HmoA
MLKVRFELTHPDLDFHGVIEGLKEAHVDSDYEFRMQGLIKDKVLLWRETANEDGVCVFYSYWSSREANEAWTKSIYESPATKLFYDNLERLGYKFVVTKEDIEI